MSLRELWRSLLAQRTGLLAQLLGLPEQWRTLPARRRHLRARRLALPGAGRGLPAWRAAPAEPCGPQPLPGDGGWVLPPGKQPGAAPFLFAL